MVIPQNPSTRNDISLSITSLQNLHYQYCTLYFGAIPVKYVCGYGDPAFEALVPVTYLLKITLPLWVALPVGVTNLMFSEKALIFGKKFVKLC